MTAETDMGALAAMIEDKPRADPFAVVERVASADSVWHVAACQPNREWTAHRWLRRVGYATLLLHYRVTVRHARTEVEKPRPLYPGYIFVAVDDDRPLWPVPRFPGVQAVTFGGERPLIIGADEFARLADMADETGLIQRRYRPRQRDRVRLDAGQLVELVEGPFVGFPARVVVDNGTSVRISVDVFRRDVDAIVPPRALKIASPATARA